MDNNKSWSSIGNEIRDAVEEALKTGNFENLDDTVCDALSDVARGVTSKVKQAVSGITGENQTAKWENATRQRKQAQEQQMQEQQARQAELVRQRAPFRRVGRVSSILYKVFGGIGTGVMGILSAVFLGISLANGGGWWITFSMLALVLAFFVGMVGVGCKQKKRLERAEKYLELAGNNHYINVEDLALHTNAAPQFVLKEIRKMLTAGHFPQGHLDIGGSCLMLDDRIYREYLDLEKQRKIQEREQRAQELRNAAAGNVRSNTARDADSQGAVQGSAGSDDAELNAMIAEGQECIRRLRDMNDNIPGEEISAKLFRLENLLKEIFEGLREHPEQRRQMQKFMNYYLPTTIKLVEAYEEFDSSGSRSREIIEAKTEIEKTLDTINSAFEELLGRMLRDTAFDVTADAQVLQTMLAKEGLAGQDIFAREREPEKVPR
ncbi:MAG: 5-bromo-4-chloroindolyl phosphate hydrolysis family protein [Butyrivibrio sp.]|nr:5-bromo-4-chloroindolyl phosphate hydrolysis family protein [Acetatifactor muris]MCM1560509.1 5-bromo-4-chloroindolyl phosphate hydrolysis family protein [Butyrivibrio sp.]